MKRISDMIEVLDEEIEGAKRYAEQYIDYKVRNSSSWSQKFKDMAADELKHATTIHDKIVEDIEELKRVYVPPVEMKEIWDREHQNYIEKIAWIKQMLTM